MGKTTGRNLLNISNSETVTLPCRQCGLPVEADVWIIVDIEERPDLLARLRAGTLHDVACPACGHMATINAPVLIYRPNAEPALLFSPVTAGTPEQDEEQAMALVSIFRENMGGTWRDEWLAHGLTGVARAALPTVLDDDPTMAAGLAAAHAAGGDEVDPALRQTLENIVLSLAAEGVRIQTAEDLQRALETRPEMKARLGAALNKQ